MKILWISASMIVPIAKVFITNERIVFFENFKKLTLIKRD